VKTVWTLGHSNRPLADFLALLQSQQIEHVADVRRFPGSRRHPHFGSDALAAALAKSGIAYTHFPALGGRRTQRGLAGHHRRNGRAESSEQNVPVPLALNTGWRVPAFSAYADYMQTDEFARAFQELTALAQNTRTAIMCAEVLPWRCHRRLIADQFTANGWNVRDIIALNSVHEHTLPPFASVNNGRLTYPGES